jgi:Protein of unknown function (DUF3027)
MSSNGLVNDHQHRHATHQRWVKQRNRQPELEGPQCGMCRFWVPLAGPWGADWGACTNPASPRDGRAQFEHDGCHQHQPAPGGWIVPGCCNRLQERLQAEAT